MRAMSIDAKINANGGKTYYWECCSCGKRTKTTWYALIPLIGRCSNCAGWRYKKVSE